MFLSAYHFDGDPTTLVPAYDRMQEGFPPDMFDLHACVVTGSGITVYDGCPSRADFERFAVSPEFRSAVAAAGLPQPRIQPLGEVHYAVAGKTVLR
ncbi:hypothetical protein ACFQ34_17840 [Pseudonocardia benzenivorans]|jgi:hypothetical protein|uniref:EthD domain-containing protein n=1 Tax=Pseudonocardia benzenivorans TaxID=228005 RepID=A0ABW3VLL7_9PSEU